MYNSCFCFTIYIRIVESAIEQLTYALIEDNFVLALMPSHV